MRLTESDAGFLYGETASGPLQTAGVLVVDGELPFERFYEHMAARVHLVERFRQRLMWVPMNLAHPKWLDDPDFDLANHIQKVDLPPGTPLHDAIDSIVEHNEGLMDRERPMWKFVLFTGVPDKTLVLQQVHHAMIDGASAVHISTILLDFQPDAPAPDPAPPWNPPPLPSALELISEAMLENAQSFVSNNPIRTIQRDEESNALMQRGVETMSRFLTRPAITAPWNAGLLGPSRKMRWTEHDFGELREIRRAFGGTINDVVLAAMSEGAARYLQLAGEPAGNQYFRVMCPVNVRTENESGALGNRVSAIFPMLPAWTMEPVERLKAVVEETGRIKEGHEAQAMTLMQESGVTTPPVAMAPLQLVGTAFDPTAWAARFPTPLPPKGLLPRPPFYGMNFVCTNVPGVQVPQYIAGHEVLTPTGIMMLGGTMGYGIAVTSYNQKMIFNFTAETRLMPDLERMVEEVEQAYADLLTAAREHNGAGS